MEPVTTGQIYWGAVPFVVIQVVMVLLVILFPSMVMHYKGAASTIDPNTIKIDVPQIEMPPLDFGPPEELERLCLFRGVIGKRRPAVRCERGYRGLSSVERQQSDDGRRGSRARGKFRGGPDLARRYCRDLRHRIRSHRAGTPDQDQQVRLGPDRRRPAVDGLRPVERRSRGLVEHQLNESVSSTAQIVFFLIGAMTIVEVIDAHNGFDVITSLIRTSKQVTLMWLVGFVTFFLSAILDNLTTTIVMISLMRKLLGSQSDRLFFAAMIVIAANAGGAWSAIGDVTTTMLWIGGQITPLSIIKGVFLASLVNLVVPLVVVSYLLKGKGSCRLPSRDSEQPANQPVRAQPDLLPRTRHPDHGAGLQDRRPICRRSWAFCSASAFSGWSAKSSIATRRTMKRSS